MANSTRAKFRVHQKIPGYGSSTIVKLSPVYSPDPEHENRQFWDATPQGSIDLVINNPVAVAVFEENKEYYVDFTPAE